MIPSKWIQWLWFGTSKVPERPRYRVCETRGLFPSVVSSEEVPLPLVGVKLNQPWATLKHRFKGRWLSRVFQRHYHWSNSWAANRWRGVPCFKTPCDLLMYQEIVSERQPDVIIECGTFFGGTTLFLADLCELMGNGKIITIDTEVPTDRDILVKGPLHRVRPTHGRIHYLVGFDDADPHTLDVIQRRHISEDQKIMVILDSDHTYEHVKKQLELYHPLVTPGQYLIVEDTNVGWLIKKDMKPGPMKAVREFLADHPEFYIDYDKERNMLTFNPCGYLRRR